MHLLPEFVCARWEPPNVYYIVDCTFRTRDISKVVLFILDCINDVCTLIAILVEDVLILMLRIYSCCLFVVKIGCRWFLYAQCNFVHKTSLFAYSETFVVILDVTIFNASADIKLLPMEEEVNSAFSNAVYDFFAESWAWQLEVTTWHLKRLGLPNHKKTIQEQIETSIKH